MSARTIADFDSDANRLRAAWDKMFNYASSFGREFRRLRDEFPKDLPPDKWGAKWDFDRWMILKVGPSEKTALRMLEILDKGVSATEREKDRERMAEIRAQQKAEAAKRKAEEHAAQMARTRERQQKRAAAQSPKERKEAEKKDRNLLAKVEAAEAKIIRAAAANPRAILTNGAKANGVDPLAARAHAAERKIAQGKELWIVGVMELAMVMAQIRDRYPNNLEFGDWLRTNGLHYERNAQGALIAMGHMAPKGLRVLLEATVSRSLEKIWRDFQQGSSSEKTENNRPAA